MMIEDIQSLVAEILFFAIVAVALFIWRKRAED